MPASGAPIVMGLAGMGRGIRQRYPGVKHGGMSTNLTATCCKRSLAALLLACIAAVAATPAEDACNRAMHALKAGDFRSARESVDQCLKLEPHYPGGRSLAAEIESAWGLDLASSGRVAESVAHFRAVTELQPSFAGGHYNLGVALFNLDDAAGAEKSFRAVLKLSPNHAKAQGRLAQTILAEARAGDKSRMPEAARAFERAIRLSPDDPDLHFNRASALAALGDDNGAQAEYQAVIRLKPDYSSAQSFLGFTLYRLGDWAGAVSHLREALAQGQDDFFVHYHLGSTLLKENDRRGAEEHLVKAASLGPQNPGVHFLLAALYRAEGDKARAATEQKLFGDLSAQEEAKARIEMLQTAAKSALDRGELAQGINALKQAYDSRPDAVTARNLALAHLQKGNIVEARMYLAKALEQAPNDAATYNYLGLLEAREGNLPAAQKDFETAANLAPFFADAAYNAGVAALERGENGTAIRHFESALSRSDTPRIREALALALSNAGRHEEAQKHFEAAQKAR